MTIRLTCNLISRHELHNISQIFRAIELALSHHLSGLISFEASMTLLLHSCFCSSNDLATLSQASESSSSVMGESFFRAKITSLTSSSSWREKRLLPNTCKKIIVFLNMK